ncbi:hypothetical protein [Sinorhizobium meliloti]|uniref:hypothetical protein n=1 Tax=Rhizobium meliloti TaxID=382 RepID=UPI001294BAE1|nr:hypothetical protein [Sinorhizobium meliloti]MQX92081.1 hypothetical protein [Sinorhizobium meliloti]
MKQDAVAAVDRHGEYNGGTLGLKDCVEERRFASQSLRIAGSSVIPLDDFVSALPFLLPQKPTESQRPSQFPPHGALPLPRRRGFLGIELLEPRLGEGRHRTLEV